MRRCVCSFCTRQREEAHGWRIALLMLVGSCIAIVCLVILNLLSPAP